MMMMALASVPVKHLDDITECPICKEVFTDHRVLPCMHAYCLQCLESWARKISCEDITNCPQCRSRFTVPPEGFAALPKNFFIEKLLAVKMLCSASDKMCDVGLCKAEEDANQTGNAASVYCPECQLHYCDQCAKSHQRIKALTSHKLVELGGQLNAASVVKSIHNTSCARHVNKDIEVFCVDCKVAICMLCYLNSHQSHKCSDLENVAEDFRKHIMADVTGASTSIGECDEILETIAQNEADVDEQIEAAVLKIRDEAAKMKKLIDDELEQLMEELKSRKQKRKKDVQMARQEAEQHKMCLESFSRYCEELCSSGTACDVARAASSVQSRGSELLQHKLGQQINSLLANIRIDFVPSESALKKDKELLGKIAVSTGKGLVKCSSDKPEVVRCISANAAVLAMTTVGECLIALLVNEDKPQVDVYNSASLKKQHSLQIPGLRTTGIGSSAERNILYVVSDRCVSVDTFDQRGINVKDVQKQQFMQHGWSKGRQLAADLCVTAVSLDKVGQEKQQVVERKGTLVAISSRAAATVLLSPPNDKLFKLINPEPVSMFVSENDITILSCINYTTFQLQVYNIGRGRRDYSETDIKVQTVGIPRQVLSLSNCELFVIAFDTGCSSDNALCIVNARGNLIRTYSRTQMKQRGAVFLAVDKHENILVADQGISDKILVLDKSLRRSFQQPLQSAGNEQLTRSGAGPTCLHLDEAKRRLYVGLKNQLMVHDNFIDLGSCL